MRFIQCFDCKTLCFHSFLFDSFALSVFRQIQMPNQISVFKNSNLFCYYIEVMDESMEEGLAMHSGSGMFFYDGKMCAGYGGVGGI